MSHWDKRIILTTKTPIDGHLSHLRHLTSKSACKRILSSRYTIPKKELDSRSKVIVNHIKLAIEYYESSNTCTNSIRPLLQYYCYLNLAVAVVEAHRKSGQSHRRNHGLQDRSNSISKIGLKTVVAKTSNGALTDFHSVLSSSPIANKNIRLLDLAVCFPFVHSELEEAFKIVPTVLKISSGVIKSAKGGVEYCAPVLQLDSIQPEGRSVLQARRVQKTFPFLHDDFMYHSGKGSRRVYSLKRQYSGSDRHRLAKAKLDDLYLKYSNFGSGIAGEQHDKYEWFFYKDSLCIPALSAGMMFAFVAASICRYRPVLMEKISASRYNLLFESFELESPGIMISSMRNMLYKEQVSISSSESV